MMIPTVTSTDIFSTLEQQDKILNHATTHGFIAAMASAPYHLSPEEWLSYLWGGDDNAPFSSAAQLEQYCEYVVELWNNTKESLLEGSWQWAGEYTLDDVEIVNLATRDFCEGFLQGWQLCRDDWEALMPQDSEDSALLGGVLLSLSMLYDPETSLETLSQSGHEGLDQFTEIFTAIPVMLCGLAKLGQQRANQQ
jgi:uncharacterized protein